MRRTSLTRAAEIFARAEVEIGWVHCPARCGRAPSPDQLILRMTRSPATAIGVGSSLIDPVLQAGRLATVYVDQVDAMARRSNTDRVAILSRAIAHEIGHLLLGTAEHTRSGLMRGIWTAEELRRNQVEDWQFSPFQRTVLRARARGRQPGAVERRGSESPGRPRRQLGPEIAGIKPSDSSVARPTQL